MSVNISKKKKEEFDNIFYEFNSNNILLDTELFKKMFNSDFYDIFMDYINDKITRIINTHNIFYLHVNISFINLSDLYYYDKILLFAKLLHKYTKQLVNIYIYGSSVIFENVIQMINTSLDYNINNKLIFESKNNPNIKINNIIINKK